MGDEDTIERMMFMGSFWMNRRQRKKARKKWDAVLEKNLPLLIVELDKAAVLLDQLLWAHFGWPGNEHQAENP